MHLLELLFLHMKYDLLDAGSVESCASKLLVAVLALFSSYYNGIHTKLIRNSCPCTTILSLFLVLLFYRSTGNTFDIFGISITSVSPFNAIIKRSISTTLTPEKGIP